MGLFRMMVPFREGEGTAGPGGQQPGTPAIPPVAPAGAPAATPAPGGKNRSVITLSNDALNDRLSRAGQTAVKKEREQLDAKARELGFADHVSMIDHVTRSKQTPAAPAAAPAADKRNGGDRPRNGGGNDREREKWKADRERLAKDAAESDKRARRLQRQLDATKTEMQLRRVAAANGLVSEEANDYALHLYQRHVENMSEDQLKTFNEGEFFGGLRKNPKLTHLFEVGAPVPVPVTTGPGSGAPPAPQPGPAGGSKGFDARSATKEERDAYLKRMGVTPPS